MADRQQALAFLRGETCDEGIVSVRLTGACGGCPMSTMTLKMGIERLLLEQVPGVRRVEAV